MIYTIICVASVGHNNFASNTGEAYCSLQIERELVGEFDQCIGAMQMINFTRRESTRYCLHFFICQNAII